MWKQRNRSCQWSNIPSSSICLVLSRHWSRLNIPRIFLKSVLVIPNGAKPWHFSNIFKHGPTDFSAVMFFGFPSFLTVGWKASVHAPWIRQWRRIVLVTAFDRFTLFQYGCIAEAWLIRALRLQVLKKRRSPSQWPCSLLHWWNLAFEGILLHSC